MKRWLVSLVCSFLVHGVATCQGQGDTDCEPLTNGSLRAAADRYSLSPDQRHALDSLWVAGTLREPSDLENVPGLGTGLREVLEAAFCWSPPWKAEFGMNTRTRPEGYRNEGRTYLERGTWGLKTRLRWDSQGQTLWRGAFGIRGRGWKLVAGSLQVRRGLGLHLVTPGAEVRGSAPRQASRGSWSGSTSVDPAVVHGAAIGVHTGRVYADVVGVKGSLGSWWSAVETGVTREALKVGVTQVLSPGEYSVGVHASGTLGKGSWAAEAARSSGGTARGITWTMGRGVWHVRASMIHIGAGYRVPSSRSLAVPAPDHRSQLQIEGRWQAGRGRFVRLGVSGSAKPHTWSQEERLEVELGEAIAVGAGLRFFWRRDRTRTASLDRAEELLVRAEIHVNRSGWHGLARVEERSIRDGRSRLTAFRLGRGSRWGWQVRVAQVDIMGAGASVWWYGRRAGGVYGWDRLSTGTWLGAWIQIPVKRSRLEVSGDVHDPEWDLAMALRVPVG